MVPESKANEYLIGQMVAGIIPWKCQSLFPRNLESGLRYSASSAIMLSSYTITNKKLGQYWYSVDDSNDFYTVVHNNGFSKIQYLLNKKDDMRHRPDYYSADKIVEKMEKYIKIEFSDEGKAYFLKNKIQTPSRVFCFLNHLGLSGYYTFLFHELMHFDEFYIKDMDHQDRELRAEIGSAFLMSELGIPQLGYHEDMLGGGNMRKWKDCWLEKMKKDPYYIFKISESALQSVDSILKKVDINEARMDENFYYN